MSKQSAIEEVERRFAELEKEINNL